MSSVSFLKTNFGTESELDYLVLSKFSQIRLFVGQSESNYTAVCLQVNAPATTYSKFLDDV